MQPLIAASTRGTARSLADDIGVHDSTVARWRRNGIGYYAADKAACRLQKHPAEIWPDWFDTIEPDDAA